MSFAVEASEFEHCVSDEERGEQEELQSCSGSDRQEGAEQVTEV